MIPQKLIELAAQKADFAQKFHNELKEWMDTIPPLGQNKFWALMDEYTNEIVTYRFGLKRSNGVEQAAQELFRQAVFETPPDQRGPKVLDLVGFINTFNKVHRIVGKRLKRCWDGSCDGFNDLVDSVVILGKPVFDKIKARPNSRQLIEIVGEAAFVWVTVNFKDDNLTAERQHYFVKSMIDFVLKNNENYVKSYLGEAAEKYLFHFFCELNRK